MTNHEPKHPPADMAGLDELIERLEETWCGHSGMYDRHHLNPDGPEAATQLQALAARVKVLEAEVERLRGLLLAQSSNAIAPDLLQGWVQT